MQIYAHTRTHTCTHTYACMFVILSYVHTHVRMNVCMYAFKCTKVQWSLDQAPANNIRTLYEYMDVYICIHTCIHVCINFTVFGLGLIKYPTEILPSEKGARGEGVHGMSSDVHTRAGGPD
jgi:hypothetical protein